MTEGEVPKEEYSIDFGMGDVKREGKDLTIIAWSNMVHRALEAAEMLGIASDIASVIQEEAFDYLNAPVGIIAGKNTPIPFNLELEKLVVPGSLEIYEAAKKIIYN
jgi:pyruvate dehydrogenase E1 component beta subunit